MQVNIIGFEWEIPQSITLGEFFKYLHSKRNKEELFGGHNRLIFVGETARYHTGLLLTAKSHRSDCQLRRGKIDVRQVEAGTNLIDFNFFVLQKDTARGMYQYYHQSCHLNKFSQFCQRHLDELQSNRMAAEIVERGGDEKIDKTQQAQIAARYGDLMTWKVLVRPENFETLVKRFRKISDFQFDFATIEPEQEQKYRRFQGVSNKISHRVTFKRKASTAERSSAILDFLSGHKGEVGDASVRGMDSDGLEKTLALMDNPDSFGHYHFDAVTKHMKLDPAKFQDSWFMKELIRIADAHQHILGVRAK